MNLPQENIWPRGGGWGVPVFLTKLIATCDFPGGGGHIDQIQYAGLITEKPES